MARLGRSYPAKPTFKRPLASAALTPIAGTLTVTLDNATLSSTAALAVKGTLTVTLDAATLSSTAAVAVKANAAVTLDAATLSSTAAIAIKATETTSLDDATLSSTAALAIKANASVTLEDATLSSATALLIQGSTSTTLDAATLASTIIHPEPSSGPVNGGISGVGWYKDVHDPRYAELKAADERKKRKQRADDAARMLAELQAEQALEARRLAIIEARRQADAELARILEDHRLRMAMRKAPPEIGQDIGQPFDFDDEEEAIALLLLSQ